MRNRRVMIKAMTGPEEYLNGVTGSVYGALRADAPVGVYVDGGQGVAQKVLHLPAVHLDLLS